MGDGLSLELEGSLTRAGEPRNAWFGEGDLAALDRELADGDAKLDSGNDVLLAFEVEGDDRFEVANSRPGWLEAGEAGPLPF